ncbi:hypothetical protein AQUCO_01500422v1 [Aquilegia coerulea]|uniref:SGNH hydrolase-type esterase domain-containing protein n=1 Tax=Aquilegia coerulea TaxID=218851 RepID=A0A2G5DTM6_AQUCA|nr:hypothetical protein AQUCO_01500422v1 [Aquilegia coerulea]
MDYSFTIIFVIVFISFLSVPCSYVQAQTTTNHSVSAILVFGDSTVDPGNNNHLVTAMKADYPPYGIDMPNHASTGRFCNGKLTTDFIASYLGIKDYVPPYLDLTLGTEELKTGVSFASAGSGYDPLTGQSFNVIPVQKQLEFFKNYKAKLESAMGTNNVEGHIQNALFIISSGTNDLAANYFFSPVRRSQYSVAEYQNFMLQNAKRFVQGLLDLGARKIAIIGLPPIGCSPSLLALNHQHECIETYSIPAKQFNQILQEELKAMQNANPGVLLIYADMYEPLQGIIKNYKESGYVESSRGCCGTKIPETSYLCTHLTPREYTSICSQPQTTNNHSVSAILVFGDSTVDPGNNNHLVTAVRADFPPYGIDMPNHASTGRFCNGKLTTDFIASYLGIKDYVPPYLDITLGIEELKTGVSFASAGSGYDPLTGQAFNVIPVQKQLEFFKDYKAKLESAMGTDNVERHIQNAIFLISCGTNDLAANYFISPVRRSQYSVAEYQNFMLQNAKHFVQGLLDLGARKIAMVGLPPIGCLPFLLALNHQHECIETYSIAAKQFNQMLQEELKAMQNANPGVLLIYADIYEPLQGIIQNYKESGYVESSRGCCGTEISETSYLCTHLTPVCPDRSKYIFWDAVHPTERVYQYLFTTLRSKIDSAVRGLP